MVTSNYIRLTPDQRSKQGALWNKLPCKVSLREPVDEIFMLEPISCHDVHMIGEKLGGPVAV